MVATCMTIPFLYDFEYLGRLKSKFTRRVISVAGAQLLLLSDMNLRRSLLISHSERLPYNQNISIVQNTQLA
jgi:hypothetical protein